MGKLEKFKETEGKKEGIADGQFHRQLDRELKGAERRSCNETYDVRDKVTSGDPFTPSAKKVLASDLRHSEKPSVGHDANLHADTTEPGINNVLADKKGGFTESAEKSLSRQKDKKVPDATKRKVFQG